MKAAIIKKTDGTATTGVAFGARLVPWRVARVKATKAAGLPAEGACARVTALRVPGIWSHARARSGASLIVALFFMLVCIAVCTVVVSGAAVVPASLAQKAESDRYYNAANSAINQIDAMFSSSESLGGVSYKTASPYEVSGSLPNALQENSSASIEQRIERWIETAHTNKAQSTSTGQDTTTTTTDDLVAYVTVKLNDDAATELPKVKLIFSMDDDLVITLYAVCVDDADNASATDAEQTTEGPMLKHLYSKNVNVSKNTFTYATSTQNDSTESTNS